MPAALCRLPTWATGAATLVMVVTMVCHAERTEGHGPVVSRSKRQTTCAPKFKVTAGHTACLPGRDVSASTAERKVILDQHNQFRATASPTASDMLVLKWDDEIAMLAQKWADNCQFKHDNNRNVPGRLSVGQNIAMGTKSWTEAVALWHSEVKNFVYGELTMNSRLSTIGHYTAVMWAQTKLVGCGSQTCNGKIFHVCNYAKSGNLGGQLHQPYKSGTSCGDCQGHCTNSLCDCPVTCLNEGTLDLNSCTCKCQAAPPLHMAPDCALNCSGTDVGWCADKGKCPDHSTWCPHKCGVCPYAGVGYDGPPPNGAAERPALAWPSLVCVSLTLIATACRLGL